MSTSEVIAWVVISAMNIALFVGNALMLRSNGRLLDQCGDNLAEARRLHDEAVSWVTTGDEHTCDTGHFDRTICPEPCGSMHSYCATCGVRQDPCAHDATTPPTDTASAAGGGDA